MRNKQVHKVHKVHKVYKVHKVRGPLRALCLWLLELPLNTVRRTPVILRTLWTFTSGLSVWQFFYFRYL